MTDRDEALRAISAGDRRRAQAVLGRARNKSLLGAADGTITDQMWESLPDLVAARSQSAREVPRHLVCYERERVSHVAAER